MRLSSIAPMCLLAALCVPPARADHSQPWQPWCWPKKTQIGGFSVYGGQRFSLIQDQNLHSLYLRDYDLALFMDQKLTPDQQLRTYVVLNPYYVHNPQVKSGFWPIYAYWDKQFSSGRLQIGKVPVAFNYRNDLPEWHSQVRRVTRIWDWGATWQSNVTKGARWSVGVANDGTSPAAGTRSTGAPTLFADAAIGADRPFEVGVSVLGAHNRDVTGIGRVHDISRYGGHFRWTPSSAWELRGEYVQFTSLTQCGLMNPLYADKSGYGWVVEGLHQFDNQWQVFANYNALHRDRDTASEIGTLILGGRHRLSEHLYLIPELWFVKDQIPAGKPLHDDNRYIMTLLLTF